MTWLPTLLAHVSPLLSVSVSWRALRRSPPVVPSLAPEVQASPLVPAASCLCLSACIPSHCNRTRLSSSLPDLNPPAGSRESPLPLRAQHLSQHLVPSCAEWKHMKGKRRAERTGGETERVPYWQKETAWSFYTLPAEAAFPAEPSCASTSERSSDFEVPVAPSRGTLANASSAPLFFSSCLIFARLTLLSSLLPQPYFLLHFSIHFSPGYSTFIPYFRKKKMTIFSYYGPISVPLGIRTELYGDSLSFYLPSFTGSKASAMSPSA